MYSRRFFRSLFILIALVLLSFPGLGQISAGNYSAHYVSAQTPPSCPANSIFRWTLIGSPPSMNPNTIVTNTAGFILAGLEYTGVETYDPYGNVNNDTFFTSSTTHNANYTQWTFNVKPGLKWSNGEPITAQDIIATANMSANPTYDYAGLGLFVTKMYAPNNLTAVFDLNQSDAWLPLQLTQDGIPGINTMPASTIQQIYPSGPNLGTDVVNGPFYLYNFHVGDLTATMYRNPYWKPQPAICEIQINFVESLSLGAERLQSGASNLAFIAPTDAAAISSQPNLHVLDEKGIGIATLEYNDSVYPYNDTAFRQALVYGINQSEYISQALAGYGVPAYNAEGIVTPVASRWYDPNQTNYSYNTTKALDLLKSMGITLGSDSLLHYRNGTAVALTIWTDTGNTEDLIGASSVQKDLSALGFTVNIEATSSSNLVGDYVANSNGIRNSLILFSAEVYNPGAGVVDSYPGWALYWAPPVPNNYWIYPPSANAQYLSNYSAMQGTDNFTLDKQYLDNIQTLNSQYLPTIVLAYPDELYGYSTAHWTNWPTGYFDEGVNSTPNFTAWDNLIPSGSSTATATTSLASSTGFSSSSSSSTSANSSFTATLTTGSSGSSTSLGSSLTYAVIAIVVIIIIIIIAVGVLALRRTRTKKG